MASGRDSAGIEFGDMLVFLFRTGAELRLSHHALLHLDGFLLELTRRAGGLPFQARSGAAKPKQPAGSNFVQNVLARLLHIRNFFRQVFCQVVIDKQLLGVWCI